MIFGRFVCYNISQCKYLTVVFHDYAELKDEDICCCDSTYASMKHGYGHGHRTRHGYCHADITNNLKNQIIQCNYKCRCRTRHQDTPNPRSVRASNICIEENGEWKRQS